jgi:hypothetical protein
VVEASMKHETKVVVAHLTLVPSEPMSERAMAEAGAQRLLAAVAELQLRKEGQSSQVNKRRKGLHLG